MSEDQELPGGIRVREIGGTWWGRLWIRSLERRSFEERSRLARGRHYARLGRTLDLIVRPGEALALVVGASGEPHDVKIGIQPFSAGVWTRVALEMAKRARFVANLLVGQMPEEIERVFSRAGASLFPTGRADLQTECSCTDPVAPCKHVAAAHYVLAEALDRDPFLLFELRGKTRRALLAEVGRARGVPAPGSPETTPDSIELGRFSDADYRDWRGRAPALHFSFAVPPPTGTWLRPLGTPPGWMEEPSFAEVVAPFVAAAAREAVRIAFLERDAEESDPRLRQ